MPRLRVKEDTEAPPGSEQNMQRHRGRKGPTLAPAQLDFMQSSRNKWQNIERVECSYVNFL